MSAMATALESSESPSPPAALGELLDARREARVFQTMRWRMLSTVIHQAVSESRFRAAVVAFVSIIFWIGLFALFSEGFVFLRTAIESASLRAQTVQAIYNIFFLALTVMLTMSSAIISYSNMFRGEEIAYLLTLPARPGRIVLFKFQEAVVFSCWGFLLLGSPMLIAYGITSGSPWYYYVLILPFMISFVLIPTGIGTLLCILVVYFLPTLRLYALALAGAVAIVAAAVWGYFALSASAQDMLTPDWFQQILARLRFSEQRLLPSWWLSSGLLEAAHPVAASHIAWKESLWFLATLSANALLAQVLAVEVGSRLFRSAYSGLQGLVPSKRQARAGRMDRWLQRAAFWMSRPMRTLIVKDFQVFRRDPVQWSQFAIFFGLLSLYFVNIRRFNYGEPMAQWMTMVGFMNLAVVGLILSTFTTRFIFPMISLEGRRFWILGTAPLERETILWAKFLFASIGSVIPCGSLILLSDVMLRVAERTPVIAVIHQITCLALCLGLSAMAVGMGARLPNLREPSPSKIAAGFGGTLNLILNMFYILAVVLSTAIPSYYWIEKNASLWMPLPTTGWFWQHFGLGTPGAVVLGVGLTIVLGVLGTLLPLRMGMRAFAKLEP